MVAKNSLRKNYEFFSSKLPITWNIPISAQYFLVFYHFSHCVYRPCFPPDIPCQQLDPRNVWWPFSGNLSLCFTFVLVVCLPWCKTGNKHCARHNNYPVINMWHYEGTFESICWISLFSGNILKRKVVVIYFTADVFRTKKKIKVILLFFEVL